MIPNKSMNELELRYTQLAEDAYMSFDENMRGAGLEAKKWLKNNPRIKDSDILPMAKILVSSGNEIALPTWRWIWRSSDVRPGEYELFSIPNWQA